MEPRVESHATRSAATNPKSNMFQAGISNKFTKRHITNFHDTTLTAASAAKARAELKMERQASAIDKQQQKIEDEMRKIEAITERLQKQQAREAKRLRSRLMHAASRIQLAYRAHLKFTRTKRTAAAVEIQRHWRGCRTRQVACELAAEQRCLVENYAARVITHNVRVFAYRLARRREKEWRDYAATVIQSATRRLQARRQLNTLRRSRDEKARAHRAAAVIQAHSRGFLTRLVYMDVLYLVCRIQSVARGFLVRKRLRWLLSLNLRAIVKLQALARGFHMRRRILPLLQSRQVQALQPTAQEARLRGCPIRRASKPRLSLPIVETHLEATSQQLRLARQAHKSPSRQATFALATMASIRVPAPSPPRIKRSYWLPSGASNATKPRLTRQRLSPVRRPVPSCSVPRPTPWYNDVHAFDQVAAHVINLQRMVRGKLLAKQRPPLRLAPLERLGDNDNRLGQQLESATTDDEKRSAEERHEREEHLKRKQLARRVQERKRLEMEYALRLQHETEESERKLMEREEKLTRLVMKTTQRKHHEMKLRRLTLDQQREEKERAEMLREERLTRLHLKRIRRLSNGAGTKRYGSRHETVLESSESDPESDDGPTVTITKKQREQDVGISYSLKLQPQRRKNALGSVPVTTKPSKARSKPSDIAKKKTRELRAVYGGAVASNQMGTRDEEHRHSRDLQAQYASWNFHSDEFGMHADLVEDDAEFDYGNEFEEVIDETNLKRLIC